MGNTILYQAKLTHLQACKHLLSTRMSGSVPACNNPSPQPFTITKWEWRSCRHTEHKKLYPRLASLSSMRLRACTSAEGWGRTGGLCWWVLQHVARQIKYPNSPLPSLYKPYLQEPRKKKKKILKEKEEIWLKINWKPQLVIKLALAPGFRNVWHMTLTLQTLYRYNTWLL